MKKTLSILGTRGIPASHGGFETFAQQLALYLAQRDWHVRVYCQESQGDYVTTSLWNGIERVQIPVRASGALGTIVFDWKSTWHAARQDDRMLVLGYNTALFSALYKFFGKYSVMNMDGLEWKRRKYQFFEKSWLYINEFAGACLSDHLIADHPNIAIHLEKTVAKSKITMIPYGAQKVEQTDFSILGKYDLKPETYALIIARPEPENSILEMVKSFKNVTGDFKLVILGTYDKKNTYQNEVLKHADDRVVFTGALYEKEVLNALRLGAQFYLHGHTVGGTNPSLVEALGCGMAVVAHDNEFNRWVAKGAAHYFSSIEQCTEQMEVLFSDKSQCKILKLESRKRHEEKFELNNCLGQYEELLSKN